MEVRILEDFIGETIEKIDIKGDDEIDFYFKSQNLKVTMCHLQECCESVIIKDICGDINDLLDYPILKAEERINEEGSEKWTFYCFATHKGQVDIQWYGESDFYSVSVDILKSIIYDNNN